MVTKLTGAVTKALPVLSKVLSSVIGAIVEAAPVALPALVQVGLDIVSSLGGAILSNLPLIIDSAVQIVMTLLQGFITALPQITAGALQLVLALVDGIIANLPALVAGALQMIVALATGIGDALPRLIPAIIDAVLLIVNTLMNNIGRIRRMPEAMHYGDPLLDSCYLYTLDEKFTESVKLSLGKGALEAATLYLKAELKPVRLVSEQVSGVPFARDQRQTLYAIHDYFKKHYNIDTRTIENKKRLEANGFIFSSSVHQNVTEESSVITAGEKGSYKDLNTTYIQAPVNTTTHGREYHHIVSEIAMRVGLKYEHLNAIFRRLFVKGVSRKGDQIFLLENRELYAFTLNNRELLKNVIRDAAAELHTQMRLKDNSLQARTTKKDFWLPREFLFTYDATEKLQLPFVKNVYAGYLSSAAPRSSSEKKFEKFCESATSVDWIYKNGDKGAEFFSIVYEDGFGKARVFFPDYIISVNKEIWIIETKGGFDKYGNSEDIDKFSPRKFAVLKNYLAKNNLNGGFVREDKKSGELCICTEEYSDDISSDFWSLLRDVIK